MDRGSVAATHFLSSLSKMTILKLRTVSRCDSSMTASLNVIQRSKVNAWLVINNGVQKFLHWSLKRRTADLVNVFPVLRIHRPLASSNVETIHRIEVPPLDHFCQQVYQSPQAEAG